MTTILQPKVYLKCRVVGTVKPNIIPNKVKKVSAEFRLTGKRVYEVEKGLVNSLTQVVEYNGVYYCLIFDNNLFCLSTNYKPYVDEGLVHVETKYGSKHKKELGRELGHKAKKEVTWIVRLYNYNLNSIDIEDQLISSYGRHQKHGI